MQNSILGTFKEVNYFLNQQTGYYQKTDVQTEPYPVLRLPFELKRERTQDAAIKVNAAELIHSKEKTKKGNYKFVTGIQPTAFKNWFVGNDYEMIHGQKVTSAVIVHFVEGTALLNVYYFSRFDKPTADLRLRWANYLIPILKEKG